MKKLFGIFGFGRDDTSTVGTSAGEAGRNANTGGPTQGTQEIAARQHGEAAAYQSSRINTGPEGQFKIMAPKPATSLGRDIDPLRSEGTGHSMMSARRYESEQTEARSIERIDSHPEESSRPASTTGRERTGANPEGSRGVRSYPGRDKK